MDLLKSSPQAEITVFSPLHPPETVALPTGLTTIGRASECTVPIRDRYLSRRHAEIVPVSGDWILKDCGSANGTYLNGVRVESQKVLNSGDRIRLGDSEIVFQMQGLLSTSIAVGDAPVAPTISIPYRDIVDTQPGPTIDLDRLRILNALAVELIEDRPLDRLFGFVVDRLAQHLPATGNSRQPDGRLRTGQLRQRLQLGSQALGAESGDREERQGLRTSVGFQARAHL